ncbi:MAG: SIMPL domain-containing protein [Lachnospiraceae bacterium]|nr:SIMPL domain-containing protein [Lachnospiraceae bacterium]
MSICRGAKMEKFKEYRSVIIACIAGICAIICVVIGTDGLKEAKLGRAGEGLSATGSASVDFESDLAVWRGSFSVRGGTSKEAYAEIEKNAELVKKYFEDNGISADEMTFYSVYIRELTKEIYSEAGEYMGYEDDGYELTQSFAVSSYDVEKITNISNECTELINSGVEIISDAPEYYYTKLDELKLQLIEEATKNAKERIDIMAQNAGCQTGELLSANLGVFQITGAYSSTEDYSYGGTFNTSAKDKTASITVRLNYTVH